MQFSVGTNGHCVKSCVMFAPVWDPKIEFDTNLYRPLLYDYCSIVTFIFIILPMFVTGSSKLTIPNEVLLKTIEQRAVAGNGKKNKQNKSKNTKYENQCSATQFGMHKWHTNTKTKSHTHRRVYVRTFTSISMAMIERAFKSAWGKCENGNTE